MSADDAEPKYAIPVELLQTLNTQWQARATLAEIVVTLRGTTVYAELDVPDFEQNMAKAIKEVEADAGLTIGAILNIVKALNP